MTEEELQALMALNLNVLQQYIPYLTAVTQLQIAQGIYIGLTAEEIIAQIESAALSNAQMQTLITTALNNYSRTVTNQMMQDADKDTKYIYIGALDGRTRDKCIYYMAESGTDGITYDQILGLTDGAYSLQYGGGFNCRHKWEAKSEFGLDKRFFNPEKAKTMQEEDNGA